MEPLFLFPGTWSEWREWLTNDAPTLAGVLIAVVVVKLISRPLIGRVLRGAARSTARLSGEDAAHVDRRVRTLEGTLSWLLTFVVAFIGLGVALDTLGLNVAPLVAGVGVAGIAIGLGAQTLIKDVVNGIFILTEDQYSVGDQVTVAGISGEVVEINPRRTLLRDAGGALHTVPNSTITTATNRTPSLRRVRVDFDVPFRQVAQATTVADGVARDVATAHVADTLIPASVSLYRVVGDGHVRLSLTGEARPSAKWEVEGELYRRLKRQLENEKIEATFPSSDETTRA